MATRAAIARPGAGEGLLAETPAGVIPDATAIVQRFAAASPAATAAFAAQGGATLPSDAGSHVELANGGSWVSGRGVSVATSAGAAPAERARNPERAGVEPVSAFANGTPEVARGSASPTIKGHARIAPEAERRGVARASEVGRAVASFSGTDGAAASSSTAERRLAATVRAGAERTVPEPASVPAGATGIAFTVSTPPATSGGEPDAPPPLVARGAAAAQPPEQRALGIRPRGLAQTAVTPRGAPSDDVSHATASLAAPSQDEWVTVAPPAPTNERRGSNPSVAPSAAPPAPSAVAPFAGAPSVAEPATASMPRAARRADEASAHVRRGHVGVAAGGTLSGSLRDAAGPLADEYVAPARTVAHHPSAPAVPAPTPIASTATLPPAPTATPSLYAATHATGTAQRRDATSIATATPRSTEILPAIAALALDAPPRDSVGATRAEGASGVLGALELDPARAAPWPPPVSARDVSRAVAEPVPNGPAWAATRAARTIRDGEPPSRGAGTSAAERAERDTVHVTIDRLVLRVASVVSGARLAAPKVGLRDYLAQRRRDR